MSFGIVLAARQLHVTYLDECYRTFRSVLV